MNRIQHIAALCETVETPFFHYDLERLQDTLDALKTASEKRKYHVHYALKANADAVLLSEIERMGFGADCVSGAEIQRAIELGFEPNKIFLAGVGKTDREISLGLEHEIGAFNVESIPELIRIDEIARDMQKTARVALRINPNIDPNTHAYITTGLKENKFGINAWELEQVENVLRQATHLSLVGLHFHIGSQIQDLNVFRNLCSRVNDFQKWFHEKGFEIPMVNLGGGLGVNYDSPQEEWHPDFEAYFAIFDENLQRYPGQEVHFEPGRAVVAHCGSLISKVLYVKEGRDANFAILDAGMTELLRPALYQSNHKIINLTSNLPPAKYDVVGPICESSDCFGKSVLLPAARRGDFFEIQTTGAYGQSMSSQYNLRPLAKPYFFTRGKSVNSPREEKYIHCPD